MRGRCYSGPAYCRQAFTPARWRRSARSLNLMTFRDSRRAPGISSAWSSSHRALTPYSAAASLGVSRRSCSACCWRGCLVSMAWRAIAASRSTMRCRARCLRPISASDGRRSRAVGSARTSAKPGSGTGRTGNRRDSVTASSPIRHSPSARRDALRRVLEVYSAPPATRLLAPPSVAYAGSPGSVAVSIAPGGTREAVMRADCPLDDRVAEAPAHLRRQPPDRSPTAFGKAFAGTVACSLPTRCPARSPNLGSTAVGFVSRWAASIPRGTPGPGPFVSDPGPTGGSEAGAGRAWCRTSPADAGRRVIARPRSSSPPAPSSRGRGSASARRAA